MSYYNFYEDHDVYGQPTTPSINNFEDDFDTSNSFSNNDDFLTRFAGFELLGGILWIVIGQTKIYKRRSDREQRELVEMISEDVEDPIVLTTTEDNLPTAVAAHRINICRRREDMRTTLQGRVNYHEIVHAEIVDMGSSSTSSTQVGDSQNAPSWSPHEEAEYSGPAAIAVPERGVCMGLEPHINRIEEMVINCPRFTFAVAGSIEMTNLNVRQLNQHHNVDTFERGMSLFDSCQLAAPGLTLKVFHIKEKSRRSSMPSWATLTDDDG
eukprot:scaffold3645_cov140-Chaetoceros_neogracile.AAC.8